jgi:hypothetical protein
VASFKKFEFIEFKPLSLNAAGFKQMLKDLFFLKKDLNGPNLTGPSGSSRQAQLSYML